MAIEATRSSVRRSQLQLKANQFWQIEFRRTICLYVVQLLHSLCQYVSSVFMYRNRVLEMQPSLEKVCDHDDTTVA